MSDWGGYARTAEVSAGGDWPELPDDLYDAMVQDVSTPEERADIFNPGQLKTDFYITWEITTEGEYQGRTLRQYINLPPSYLEYVASGDDGPAPLSNKSTLYGVMEALGFDMEGGPIEVNPSSWQGEEARIMVENSTNKQGKERPKITGVKAKRSKPVTPPKRQPIGAGARNPVGHPEVAGGLRKRLEAE